MVCWAGSNHAVFALVLTLAYLLVDYHYLRRFIDPGQHKKDAICKNLSIAFAGSAVVEILAISYLATRIQRKLWFVLISIFPLILSLIILTAANYQIFVSRKALDASVKAYDEQFQPKKGVGPTEVNIGTWLSYMPRTGACVLLIGATVLQFLGTLQFFWSNVIDHKPKENIHARDTIPLDTLRKDIDEIKGILKHQTPMASPMVSRTLNVRIAGATARDGSSPAMVRSGIKSAPDLRQVEVLNIQVTKPTTSPPCPPPPPPPAEGASSESPESQEGLPPSYESTVKI